MSLHDWGRLETVFFFAAVLATGAIAVRAWSWWHLGRTVGRGTIGFGFAGAVAMLLAGAMLVGSMIVDIHGEWLARPVLVMLQLGMLIEAGTLIPLAGRLRPRAQPAGAFVGTACRCIPAWLVFAIFSLPPCTLLAAALAIVGWIMVYRRTGAVAAKRGVIAAALQPVLLAVALLVLVPLDLEVLAGPAIAGAMLLPGFHLIALARQVEVAPTERKHVSVWGSAWEEASCGGHHPRRSEP